MVPSIKKVFDFLAQSRGIICAESLGLGNVVKTVFRATDGTRSLVVKIGLSERAAEEVRTNRKGYEALRGIGAVRIIPEPIFNLDFQNIPILVMGDCGPDFYHAVRQSKTPHALYLDLVQGMKPIYAETRQLSPGNSCLEPLRSLLLEQYKTWLPHLTDPAVIRQLAERDFQDLNPPFVCFSSFDFTPEDVFVTSKGIKYADPGLDVLGFPAIDLACFAGVARDAYGLPGAEEGYEILADFAIRDLSEILELDASKVSRIFSLGRAIQCALSARFRLESNPEKATELARSSQDFLRSFLG